MCKWLPLCISVSVRSIRCHHYKLPLPDNIEIILFKVQREKENMRHDFQSANNLLAELKESTETLKREKITIEKEFRITKERYVKEIREKDVQITKVCSCQSLWQNNLDF